jgi:hypothetical protein
MRALAPLDKAGTLGLVLDEQHYHQCLNGARYDACNWLTPTSSKSDYCASCELSEQIPDLNDPDNLAAWKRMESAKRRLLFTLRELGLPVISKTASPERGLTFRFLQGSPEHPVTTGHHAGVVTIEVLEANPTFRERQKEQLDEKYRTPLGHLRHEIGHYYFDWLVGNKTTRARFRSLFGDETVSYGECLERHYRDGPPANWETTHISAYATMHPFEDWAETFAHYLHVVDVVETARSHGLSVRQPRGLVDRRPVAVRNVDAEDFDDLMKGFHVVSLALNELNRSMGLPDAYPFTVPEPARDKLRLMHDLVSEVAS